MTAQDERRRPGISTPAEAAERYRSPRRESYDVVILGAGSGGLSAATMAAALGASVALVDRGPFGGDCLNTGCVPSKALLHVARLAAQARRAGELGLNVQLGPVDLGAVADHVARVIADIYADSDAPENFEAQGVDPIIGEARFSSPDELSVNGQSLRAARYLICTGSHPVVPPVPGLLEAGYLTNETVFAARRLPADLVVIGGGPIGCELGQAFARLGSRVTILQRPQRLLPKDEPEASAVLLRRFHEEGITVHAGADVRSVSVQNGRKVVEALTPAGPIRASGEEILVAVGRAPAVAGLGLDEAGVRFDPRKGITTDAYLQTTNKRVYAAGDVIGGYLFTHAAALQARLAIRNMLFPARGKLDERVMPWATFTEPEVAHVGLTEAEARRQNGDDVKVYTQQMRGIDRAVTEGETAGLIKLVATARGKLLGAQIVGPSAGEYINELALALQQNLTLSDLAATTHAYPTVALGIQQAAGTYALEVAANSGLVRLLRRFGG